MSDRNDTSRAEAAAEEALERAREAIADAEAALENGLDTAHAYLKRQVEERPLAVVATALAVGLVLGALINGPRR